MEGISDRPELIGQRIFRRILEAESREQKGAVLHFSASKLSK
jgi:hypothetical protein